ncbi:DddA-like double-stranded DNA deaminase toxin [Saccharomonospora halophila]|uniref:DddA-like double-stranded DNA deaminase toxin n=1 Tax=Saccharomonospora halophila TaxID=129922 RepID=UPI000A00AE3D
MSFAWRAAITAACPAFRAFPAPPGAPYHVEMRAAAMLISSGVRNARVVMNNVPCGFRPGTTHGCHQALEHFLPTGTTLTVLGSDSDGRPFHHTYRGRAES